MRPYDLPKFQSTMASLAQVFGKQLSPQLADLYWEALQWVAIEQLQQAAQSWIRHGKHFPKPAELLERYQEMRQAAPKPPIEFGPALSWGLNLVNHLFFRYLTRRRMKETFRGNLDLGARRAACLDLAWYLDQCKEEDLKPSVEEITRMFDEAMAKIPDKSQTDEWLPIELERQRKENPERDRHAR